ncbi:MAG: hypothetical protein LBG75_02265 [Candidatus Nomurabacteria bacterium]|nr:hypothetical protein [Candidatus Nomurabacteria bacterium]
MPNGGKYQLEVWGAQGGNTTYGGKGGYSVGEATLIGGATLYMAVGGTGSVTTGTNIPGGFNGGGIQQSANNGTFGSGGGATHISRADGLLSQTDVRNAILIVAGGGGGAGYNNVYGGAGGGSTGGNGATSGYASYAIGQGGTQTAGGTISGTSTASNYGTATAGTAGQGGTGVGFSGGGGGGGGGWFGGSGGLINSGGGGSGYVVGLLNAQTIAGSASMPNPAGGTMTGRAGNGYIRIRWVSN